MANPVHAEFNGVSFTYDRAVTEQVNARVVPPSQYLAFQLPAFIEFTFGDHQIVERYSGVARIRVFRVHDLEQVDPMYKAAMAAHEPMPLINATRMLRVQERLLSFQNGKGTRAVVQYAQEVAPINNTDMFYTYQGVTDDGLHYVSATFPVTAPFLPASSRAVVDNKFPGIRYDPNDWKGFADAVTSFNRDAAQRLERLEAGGYTPNLEALDALIRSLSVPPSTQWSTNPQ